MPKYEYELLSLQTATDSPAVTGFFSISPPISVGEGLSKAVVDEHHHADVVLQHVISTSTETIFRCETGTERAEYDNRDAVKEMGLRVLEFANDPRTAAGRHY